MFKFLRYFIQTCMFFIFTNTMATESPVLHMVLEKGIVKIKTFPEKAPNTVKRIIELSESGFYDGLTWGFDSGFDYFFSRQISLRTRLGWGKKEGLEGGLGLSWLPFD